MVYDIFYYQPNGDLEAGFDSDVGDTYLSRVLNSDWGRAWIKTVNKNWPGPEGVTWYSPEGRQVKHDDLPWVKPQLEREERAKQRDKAIQYEKEYALRKGVNIVDRGKGFEIHLQVLEDEDTGFDEPISDYTLLTVTITYPRPHHQRHVTTTFADIGDLKRAAQNWADLPDNLEYQIYSSIASKLP